MSHSKFFKYHGHKSAYMHILGFDEDVTDFTVEEMYQAFKERYDKERVTISDEEINAKAQEVIGTLFNYTQEDATKALAEMAKAVRL